MNLIGRYIFREAFGSWLVVMAVLFLIFMTNQLADPEVISDSKRFQKVAKAHAESVIGPVHPAAHAGEATADEHAPRLFRGRLAEVVEELAVVCEEHRIGLGSRPRGVKRESSGSSFQRTSVSPACIVSQVSACDGVGAMA